MNAEQTEGDLPAEHIVTFRRDIAQRLAKGNGVDSDDACAARCLRSIMPRVTFS
jgi:hypothetical protein